MAAKEELPKGKPQGPDLVVVEATLPPSLAKGFEYFHTVLMQNPDWVAEYYDRYVAVINDYSIYGDDLVDVQEKARAKSDEPAYITQVVSLPEPEESRVDPKYLPEGHSTLPHRLANVFWNNVLYPNAEWMAQNDDRDIALFGYMTAGVSEPGEHSHVFKPRIEAQFNGYTGLFFNRLVVQRSAPIGMMTAASRRPGGERGGNWGGGGWR